jgi:hypothetical protein
MQLQGAQNCKHIASQSSLLETLQRSEAAQELAKHIEVVTFNN